MSNFLMNESKILKKEDLELIYNILLPYLPDLKEKRILLTGGTGFFGKWIIEAINYLNIRMGLQIKTYVLSRKPNKFKKNYPRLFNAKGVTFISGDVREFNFSYGDLDYVIHAATDVYAGRNSKEVSSVIIDGAKHIAMVANNTNCKKFLNISSGAVYGNIPIFLKDKGISEDVACNPSKYDAYAYGKLNSEIYLNRYLKCNLITARCFSFCGPYIPTDGPYAFGNFIDNFIRSKDIVINGDGKSIRSYMYSSDLVIWLFILLLRGKDRRTYNVGNRKPISILDLATKISTKKPLVLGNFKKNDDIYFPDTSRCEEELGLRVYTSLEESIKNTIEFLKRELD